MKSLLVSLLLVVFAQGAKAETVNLDQTLSKELYHILAVFGLRTQFPADMQTREWAHGADCAKIVNSGAHYTCLVHDQFHSMNVQKTGSVAKKLYDMIALANPIVCGADRCLTRTSDIKCTYYWPNKYNSPEVRYFCQMDKHTTEPLAPF